MVVMVGISLGFLCTYSRYYTLIYWARELRPVEVDRSGRRKLTGPSSFMISNGTLGKSVHRYISVLGRMQVGIRSGRRGQPPATLKSMLGRCESVFHRASSGNAGSGMELGQGTRPGADHVESQVGNHFMFETGCLEQFDELCSCQSQR